MVKVKVKQSHYRPGQALRVSGGWDFQISRQSAHEGGKVVSPTHRPPLPPGNIPGTHFCWRLSRPQGHTAAGRTPPGIEPATFRLVAQCLNQLRHRVPPLLHGIYIIHSKPFPDSLLAVCFEKFIWISYVIHNTYVIPKALHTEYTIQMWFLKHYIRNTTTLQQLSQQSNCSRNRHNIRQAVWYGTFFCCHQEMDPRCEWRQVDGWHQRVGRFVGQQASVNE